MNRIFGGQSWIFPNQIPSRLGDLPRRIDKEKVIFLEKVSYFFLRIGLPIEKFPIRLPFPKFTPPQFLMGDQNCELKIIGATTILFGPRPEIVGKELGAEELVFKSRRDSPVFFARMIAKIGYAMA